MNAHSEGRSAGAQADQLVGQILKAAHGWAREAPEALRPHVRAVCIRLGEMIADQRNSFAPLPEPQEAERAEVLALVASQLASAGAAEGVERQLQMLSETELRSTSSWALQPGAQSEWTTTAIGFLEEASQVLSPDERPDPFIERRKSGLETLFLIIIERKLKIKIQPERADLIQMTHEC